MKKSRGEAGITLIALVVTIVILIILAGVSVNMAIGKNGLIDQSEKLYDNYDKAAVKEDLKTIVLQYKIEKNGDLTQTLQEYLLANGITKVEETSNGDYNVEYEGYQFKITKELSVI